MVQDAERVSTSTTKTLGNWSAGQIFQHLANTFNGSIDGFQTKLPWYVRTMAKLFKKRFINGAMPAGMKLPKQLSDQVMPEPVSTETGLSNLRAAVTRLATEIQRAEHPVFGVLTSDEWDRIHLAHAQLHLSFLTPE